MKNELSAWEKEKKLIPVMIRKYCKGKHKRERRAQGVKRGGVCSECGELTEYAMFRLEKCPFKVNKKFCSFCKIHCYKPEMREKIKAVMKYSGPRMLFTHPVFAMSHVVQMIRYKKQMKAEVKKVIDKALFKLIGKNKKYIFIAVALQVLGLIANVGITASICWAICLAIEKAEPVMYAYPALCAATGMAVRYAVTRLTGDVKDVLGRKVKKDLRERTYEKIVKLGVRSTDGMSMAGLTQVSMEGVEQLDLYYSSYLPQFFFAMLAPIVLFVICVWINWRTALVLLACVPLIPVSIIAVSKCGQENNYLARYARSRLGNARGER